MAYSTLDDQKKITPQETIRQLVDDENVGSLTPTDVLARFEEVRDEADAEIDPYLTSGGYATPLSPVLPVIRAASCTITKYRLFLRRDMVPEAVRNAYKDTIRLLEKIAAGDISLKIEDEDDAPSAGLGMSVVTSSRFDTST